MDEHIMIRSTNAKIVESIKKDQDKKVKYKDAFYDMYPEEIPFIPFQHIIQLEENILKSTLVLLKKFNLSSEVNPLWGIDGIRSMFLKGVNPATAEYIAVSGKLLAKTLMSDDSRSGTVKIIEFGTGAGWATLILWTILKKNFDVTLFTVDKSPYAAASTTLLLDYFSIPYIVVKGKLPQAALNFKGIVLQFEDFTEALEYHEANFFDGAYSNHGTTYLSVQEHSVFIDKLYMKLKTNASFISDSLNPNIRLSLNKFKILMGVIKGGNVKRLPKKKDQTKKKGNINVITSLYDIPALRFMDLLHYYLIHNISIFRGYMKSVSESERTQQELYEKINVPSGDYYKEKNKKGKFQSVKVPDEVPEILPAFIQTAWLKKV